MDMRGDGTTQELLSSGFYGFGDGPYISQALLRLQEDLKRAARARKIVDIHATSATQDIAPHGIAEVQDQAGVDATSQGLQAADASGGAQLSVKVIMSQEDDAEAEMPTGEPFHGMLQCYELCYEQAECSHHATWCGKEAVM